MKLRFLLLATACVNSALAINFQPPVSHPAGGNAQSLVMGDFNGDDLPDLATGNPEDRSISVLLNNGGGTFRAPQPTSLSYTPGSFLAADFSGDGIDDLAIVERWGPDALGRWHWTVHVLLSNGDGTFKPGQTISFGSKGAVTAFDFNGDGYCDLLVIRDAPGYPADVFLSNSDGTFKPAGTVKNLGGPGSVFALGDFNGDGIPDLVNSSEVVLGNGDGTFGEPLTLPAALGTLVPGDFENRGFSDVAASGGDTVAILLGNGDGTLQSPIFFDGGGSVISVVVADFNHDGLDDVAVVNYGLGTVSVLLNSTDKASLQR